MTLSTSGYALGVNQPLSHARILWAPIAGTITADGTDGDLAANDYTFQRWSAGTLPANWKVVTAALADVDTLFIAAHNLGSTGSTILVQTAATVGGAFTTRATIVPTDDSAIAVMFNNAGVPYAVREVRVQVTGASGAVQIGIIRAGVALQMTQPVFGGVRPIGLSRMVETRHAMSETGQWLGRVIQRQASQTDMNWTHLDGAWYRSTFQPFAKALPQTPFGLIQNPSKMPESVAWCWTDAAPQPANMGIRGYMEVALSITGHLD
ncbi:MAG: hypothetical protein V4720_06210 [Pseudomonadota bacterium]